MRERRRLGGRTEKTGLWKVITQMSRGDTINQTEATARGKNWFWKMTLTVYTRPWEI